VYNPDVSIARTARLLSLAAANARGKYAEWLFVRGGRDATRPMQIYVEVNHRCNCRCRMCGYWRREPKAELSAAAWIAGLRSLKRLSPGAHVQFCAVEPLLRADLFEILNACRTAKLSAGVTTNGLLLHAENVRKLAAARLLNVNVSLDSLKPEVHDGIRGVPGLQQKVVANLRTAAEARASLPAPLRIILRTVVSRENVGELCDLAAFARDVGAAGISYQPISLATDEAKRMYEIDLPALDAEVRRLVEMKAAGAPILNSAASIRWWRDYFRRRQPAPRVGPCVVGLRNLYIDCEGRVALCRLEGPEIGRLSEGEGDIAAMWRSPQARRLRGELLSCGRTCVGTSVEKKRWRDYADTFRRLAKG